MAYTANELAQMDRASEQQDRKTEFLRAHPEYAAAPTDAAFLKAAHEAAQTARFAS